MYFCKMILNKLNKMKTVYKVVFLICCIALCSCARIVTPSGGERDIKPPVYVKSNPPINALEFQGNKIEIEFDEYIVLDNATGKLIVSPPLKKKPTVGSKLRTLYIKDIDSLEENTTYIFDFGDAITDFNEGNRLNHFAFAFSTGETIDSLSYRGKVVNAYTLKPEANKFVSLYRNTEREYIRTNLPDYITRTDSSGRFYFKNIKQGQYTALAFEDMNQNMLYDLPTEGYGQLDVTVTEVKEDTSDKVANRTDIIYYNTAEDTVQKLTASELLSDREFRLVFSVAVGEGFKVKIEKPLLQPSQYGVYMNGKRDTVTVVSKSAAVFDTLDAVVYDDNGFEEKINLTANTRRKKKKDTKDKLFLSLETDTLSYFKPLALRLSQIVNTENTASIQALCYDSVDTMKVNFVFDTSDPKRMVSDAVLKEGGQYTLYIDSAVLYTYEGYYNDTLRTGFVTDTKDSYGSLRLNLSSVDTAEQSYILTLTDVQNNALRDTVVRTKGAAATAEFVNLKEGKYKVRIIEDKNSDKKYNGGNFDSGLPPERVKYMPKTLNVRKGWVTEEDVDLNALFEQ